MTTAGLLGAGRVAEEAQATALRHLQEDGVALNIGFCGLFAWVIRIPHGG